MIHALFATGLKGEMGMSDGTLPWRTKDNRIRKDLPSHIQEQCEKDMALFKSLTTGNIIIMGYNTYRTFPSPLPGRINIVIDRNCGTKDNKKCSVFASEESFHDKWFFFPTLEEAISLCKEHFPEKEIYVIGGPKLLKEAFSKKLIDGKTYHTVIDAEFPEAEVYL